MNIINPSSSNITGSKQFPLSTLYFGLLILCFFLLHPQNAVSGEMRSGEGYTPASECGRCHQGIYQSWRRTFHALAVDNPVFINELGKAEKNYGRGMRVLCLSCHSPTIGVTMDYSLTKPISREAVTCDFCHTASSVDLHQKGMKLQSDLSPVKMGPGRKKSLPAHQTRKNALLLQSEFCAGCHQWTNENGLDILNTYKEWEKSFYKGETINCQFCHMPEILKTNILLKGKVVQRPSHLHFEMGGHSQSQLAIAAKLWLEASIEDDSLKARVAVQNFQGGHMLPTGLPSRELILQVSLYGSEGSILDREETVFKRVIADINDQPLEGMTEWFLKGNRILEDNRIAPKEKRIVNYNLMLPEDSGSMIVEAKLSYRLNISNMTPPFFDYEMVSTQKIVSRGPGESYAIRGIGVALGILIFIFIVLIIIRLRLHGEKPSSNT